MSIKGGVGIKAGPVGLSAGGDLTESRSESQSIENGSSNAVTFTYEWGSTLSADNQRAIGWAYWGPLTGLRRGIAVVFRA